MSRIPKVLKDIYLLREKYLKSATGKSDLLRIIAEAELPEHVYNSNAIENSTLTLEETEKILLQLDLDRFISEREIFEAKNLFLVHARIVCRLGNCLGANSNRYQIIKFIFHHEFTDFFVLVI